MRSSKQKKINLERDTLSKEHILKYTFYICIKNYDNNNNKIKK